MSEDWLIQGSMGVMPRSRRGDEAIEIEKAAENQEPAGFATLRNAHSPSLLVPLE